MIAIPPSSAVSRGEPPEQLVLAGAVLDHVAVQLRGQGGELVRHRQRARGSAALSGARAWPRTRTPARPGRRRAPPTDWPGPPPGAAAGAPQAATATGIQSYSSVGSSRASARCRAHQAPTAPSAIPLPPAISVKPSPRASSSPGAASAPSAPQAISRISVATDAEAPLQVGDEERHRQRRSRTGSRGRRRRTGRRGTATSRC